MSKPKVFVTRIDVPKEGIDMLKEKCEVEIFAKDFPIPKEDLIKGIKGKDALFCLLTDNVDKEVIESAGPQLKGIATMSVGFDHIDSAFAKTKNIPVSNTPGVSTDSVAEFTVTLMLAAGRNLIESASAIKKGEWKYAWRPLWLCGQGLKDAVVGIIGMGRIGQGVMDRVLPFGVKKVLYNDPFHPIKPAEDKGAVFVSIEDLVKQSDFIVPMCNLTPETKHLFCAKLFNLMKPNAVLINTSRGGVVNQDDLYDALINKKIRFAAIDVTDPEPLPSNHKLLTLPNIIICPHVGSAEISIRILMAKLAAENILLALEGKPMKSPVNM